MYVFKTGNVSEFTFLKSHLGDKTFLNADNLYNCTSVDKVGVLRLNFIISFFFQLTEGMRSSMCIQAQVEN